MRNHPQPLPRRKPPPTFHPIARRLQSALPPRPPPWRPVSRGPITLFPTPGSPSPSKGTPSPGVAKLPSRKKVKNHRILSNFTKTSLGRAAGGEKTARSSQSALAVRLPVVGEAHRSTLVEGTADHGLPSGGKKVDNHEILSNFTKTPRSRGTCSAPFGRPSFTFSDGEG